MSLGLSRFDSLQSLLAGTTTVAVIALAQATTVALTAREIAQIAVPTTVQINNNVANGGSGVLISRSGNTYTVLTANHVVKRPDLTYTIRTHTGKEYPVTQVQRLQQGENDPDLAVVTFESPEEYPIAALGDSDQADIGVDIYVSGFPALEGRSGAERDYEFSPGIVTSRPTSRSQGYSLRYNAVTVSGMSGGPVFDASGRVVGIHGQGESEQSFLSESGSIAIKTGFNSAIPIKTFMALRSQTGLSGEESVNKNTVVNNQAANLSNPTSASDYYARGLSRLELKNQQEALEDFNQAIRLNPNDANAYKKRGSTYLELGDNQRALQDLNQAIRLNPKNATNYAVRGQIREALGHKQGAIEDYTQTIRFAPKITTAYSSRGYVRDQLGDKQGALEDFNHAIRLNPNLAILYSNRGYVRDQLGDKQGAWEDFNHAIRLNPNLATAYNHRGNIRNVLGDKQGALEDFNQAIRLNPNYGNAYNNRGNVRISLGNKLGALEDFQQAANLYQQAGNTGDYQEALNRIRELRVQEVKEEF